MLSDWTDIYSLKSIQYLGFTLGSSFENRRFSSSLLADFCPTPHTRLEPL